MVCLVNVNLLRIVRLESISRGRGLLMMTVVWVKGIRSIVPGGKFFFYRGYLGCQKKRLLGHARWWETELVSRLELKLKTGGSGRGWGRASPISPNKDNLSHDQGHHSPEYFFG
jgi:hypothetical protein